LRILRPAPSANAERKSAPGLLRANMRTAGRDDGGKGVLPRVSVLATATGDWKWTGGEPGPGTWGLPFFRLGTGLGADRRPRRPSRTVSSFGQAKLPPPVLCCPCARGRSRFKRSPWRLRSGDGAHTEWPPNLGEATGGG